MSEHDAFLEGFSRTVGGWVGCDGCDGYGVIRMGMGRLFIGFRSLFFVASMIALDIYTLG